MAAVRAFFAIPNRADARRLYISRGSGGKFEDPDVEYANPEVLRGYLKEAKRLRVEAGREYQEEVVLRKRAHDLEAMARALPFAPVP